MNQATQGNYAEVNGLRMYYEIHGEGSPLVLLHGAFSLAAAWADVLPHLTATYQVILVELQGHGHTGDIDRPLRFIHMADDVAALLRQLQIPKADVFGYSMGGKVALALAMQYPDLVGRLALLGSGFGATRDIFEPETYRQFKSITPENFNYPPVTEPYKQVAPDPSNWPVLVSKIIEMDDSFHGFADDAVQAISCPTLIMLGDRDGTRPEHVVAMYRLIPHAQLAIFPNAGHFVLDTNPQLVFAVLLPFLSAPS